MTRLPAFDVRGKRVTVAGAARSGIAAAELLASRGAQVTLSDTKAELADAERLRQRGVRIELGGHVMETFTSADLVVLSPGVAPDQPTVKAARDRGVPVIGEIELAFRWLQGRVIAITGTKGKSTTTALTGRMLEAAGFKVTVGGNIGAPLSAQVPVSTPDTLHVVEASSFQLEQIDTFHPWIAVMLNFSPDHLDRHPTVEAYAAAKGRIFENQTPNDWAVINADDPMVLDLARRGRAAHRLFSRTRPLDEGTVLEDGWIVERRGGGATRLVPTAAIHLLGPHLVGDVMAAATVGAIAGATPAAMTSAVESFRGLEHAMELVAEVDGVRFVNDSKATNVESALRSIESFEAWTGADHRRPIQRRRPAAPARAAAAARKGGRRDRGITRQSARSASKAWWTCARPTRSRTPSCRRSRSRGLTVSCCSRRRARASTCSATTRSVGNASKTRSSGFDVAQVFRPAMCER